MTHKSDIDRTLGDANLGYLGDRDQLYAGYTDQMPPMDRGSFGRTRRNQNGSEYTAYETELEPSLSEYFENPDQVQAQGGFVERPGLADGWHSKTDVERN